MIDSRSSDFHFYSDINEVKLYCDSEAQSVVDSAVDAAKQHNKGRFNMSVLLIGLHENSILEQLVDPTFSTITPEDIIAVHRFGLPIQVDESGRPERLTIIGNVKRVFRKIKMNAIDQRRLLTPADLLGEYLRTDRGGLEKVTRFELLHGLADLRSGEPRD